MSRNFLFNECSSSSSASISFPDTININERKAPTDDSVKLLKEMEQKALDNVIAKVSCCDDNNVKWEAYFSQLASLGFEPMGILTLRISINGREYMRSIRLRTTMMNEIKNCMEKYGTASLQSYEINARIQRLLLFEVAVVIAQCICEGNTNNIKDVQDLLYDMSNMGLTEFEISKFEEELQKV